MVLLQDPIGSFLLDWEEELCSPRFCFFGFLFSLCDSLLIVLLFFFDLGLVLSNSSVPLALYLFKLRGKSSFIRLSFLEFLLKVANVFLAVLCGRCKLFRDVCDLRFEPLDFVLWIYVESLVRLHHILDLGLIFSLNNFDHCLLVGLVLLLVMIASFL